MTTEVTGHYLWDGAADRILAAAGQAGITDFTPESLAPADQLHAGGAQATRALAAAVAIKPGERVLDVGSGLGGPARMLAAECGADVTGIDLSPNLVEGATALTARCGLSDRVRFEQGDATTLPYGDASFDVVWTQHAVMNIEDRAALYAEMARVLKPGGRLAFQDILAGSGRPLDFPVPWAPDPSVSFLRNEAETKALLAGAGLELVDWQDVTARAAANSTEPQANLDTPGFNLVVLMGQPFADAVTNFTHAAVDGRALIVLAVYRKPA
ncbi:MAG: class I SAM-dependent methyltransferase [Dehalococcoidia bacterium]